MEHYIEIRLLPDPEFSDSIILNALFAKLHRALSDVGGGQIGVSFPKTKKTLGEILRIHGSRTALEKLMNQRWLKGLNDYTRVSEILPIPNTCKYRCVKRIQSKSNVERLYRRSVKKGWIAPTEAESKIAEAENKTLKQPFLCLKSKSSSQEFKLFIMHCEVKDKPQCDGNFSNYGLSNKKTIPWF